MKQAPIQHAVEFFFYRRFEAVILRRPHADVRALGGRLGRLAYRVLGGPRKVARNNLRKVFPERSEDEIESIVRACFEHHGAHFCETISCQRFGPEIADQFDISGWHHVEEAIADGSGCFIHSGHFGSSELALYPMSLKLGRLHAVARPPNNPHIAAEIRRLRERFGLRVIDKRGAATRMRTAVREGGQVALIIDQHVRPSVGVQVPFLGFPAWTSPALALLSLRYQVPVVPLTCEPAAQPGRYSLTFRPPILPTASGKSAKAELTERYLADVEVDIRRRPELWLWMHRRWRD